MSGDPLRLSDLPLSENWWVPRDQVFYIEKSAMNPNGPTIAVHPSTGMVMRNGGRTPLWTRHMIGVREAERDKRKLHGRKRV